MSAVNICAFAKDTVSKFDIELKIPQRDLSFHLHNLIIIFYLYLLQYFSRDMTNLVLKGVIS